MATKQKRWILPTSLAPSEAARYPGLHPILAQILHNRGFTDPVEAARFLAGAITFSDPLKMKGMAKAVARIRTAIKSKEPIIVYGDFDADGVTSTALMVSVLRALGANVKEYIPDRVDEGYGLNDTSLIKLAKSGAKVVITVDCGIRSLKEVETGNRAKLDMIITDHHSIGAELPRAHAVINPKQEGCTGESMLAGVGVAYKLAQALIRIAQQQDRRDIPLRPEDLLDLVALGTVADLAPLDRPENRALVMAGLKQLQEAKRPGINAILQVAGMKPSEVDAMAIGFTIGPRLNAAGRLKHAGIAYELLVTDDPVVAGVRAQELQKLNEDRQSLTRQMQEFARLQAGLERLDRGEDVPLIFAADKNFLQGIVGLVAGRLTEEYYRPAVIVHYDEKGESHGSCRSIAEFNITEALDECADLLIRHGGHAQAAGFAIHNDNLPLFRQRLTEIAGERLQGKDLQPSLEIDAEVNLKQINMELYEALKSLEPCGHAMSAPVLCARRLKVIEARAVGKEAAHLKLRLQDGELERDAIAFRLGGLADSLPPYVDVAFQLVLNQWNGTSKLELMVQDIRWTERRA